MTPNQRISLMNTAFGNPKGDPLNIDWARVRSQCKNIPDEVGELFQALGADSLAVTNAVAALKGALSAVPKDHPPVLDDVRDALCDIPVFTGGAQHLMGINADWDMHDVLDGVMTRFIKNDADKAETIAKHAAKGVTDVYFEGEYPTMVMKSASDQPDAPKGKFLKSASYKEAQFYDVGHWKATPISHIWYNTATKKYHYSDEAEQMDVRGYDHIADANTALKQYCENVLQGKGTKVHLTSELPSKVFSDDAIKKISGTAGDSN